MPLRTVQDPTHSLLKDAIHLMSSGHKPDHTMYYRLAPAKDGGCPWRTSEENHWVAHFTSCLLDRARRHRPGLQFHQFFEKPSHKSESKKKGGYDLSCGPYDNESFRVRTMHKVLKGLWCDCDWEWEPDESDLRHMRTLLSQTGHATYLIVNVFYCIHDWRRMGEKTDTSDGRLTGFVVPDFASPLRTLIVDLRASADRLLPDAKVALGCVGLKQAVASAGDWTGRTTAKGFMYATANGTPLDVVGVDDILGDLDGYWQGEGAWAGSKLR